MSFWMVPLRLLRLRHALLFGRHHVAGKDRQHGAVHGHRHRDLVQRNAVEQDLHVLDGIDRHAGLADVAGDARMVGVVAAVRGQVEGHRHALAAGGQRLAVEGVGRLGGGKAGVLANGPRPHRVHRGLRPAQEGREPGQRIGIGQALDIGFGVERLDGQAFRRHPVQAATSPPGADLAAALVQASIEGMLTSGALLMVRFPTSTATPCG
jgi:hypothetical protein